MHVREATAADATAIAKVEKSATATLRRLYRPLPVRMQRFAERASRLLRLVAIDDGEIVGTVQYEIMDDDRLHLINLGVLESHRKRGVARSIVEAAVRIARGAEVRRLSLYTIRETGNAEVFERLGFVVVREGPALEYVSEQPLNEVYMECVLA